MHLTDHQEDALDTICAAVQQDQQVIVLKGAAGTGKTTLLGELAQLYPGAAVVAFTNKARKVLQRKGIRRASTIHGAFYRSVLGAGGQWQHIPLAECDEEFEGYDITICDEASMAPAWMVSRMMSDSRVLILVGDGNQLPPVKSPPVFHERPADAELTDVLRHGDKILKLATILRTTHRIPEAAIEHFRHPPKDARPMFVAPFKNTVRSINAACRKAAKRGVAPGVGEPVVATDNFPDVGIYNGDDFTVAGIDWDGRQRGALMTLIDEDGSVRQVMVNMPDLLESANAEAPWDGPHQGIHLNFAYAITAHKAQGSGYPNVAVVEQSRKQWWINTNMGNPPMTQAESDVAIRRWLYTAVTRAEHHLWLCTPESALSVIATAPAAWWR